MVKSCKLLSECSHMYSVTEPLINSVTRQLVSSKQIQGWDTGMCPKRSISHLHVMAVFQEPGPLLPEWLPLCSQPKVVFMVTVLCTSGMSHSGYAVARQTAGDSCRQLQRESKLQRQCFQTAGLQKSQWRPSRSVEQEPMGLIVGHSWSACLNSVKSPRQTEATHSLCVTHCPPDRPSCHIGHELEYVFVCSQFRGFT